MPKNHERDYKSQLKSAAQEATKADLKRIYGDLADEIAAIPEGVPAQMTLLLDARQLLALRRMQEETGVSRQEIIRSAIIDAITRKLGKTAPPPAPAQLDQRRRRRS